MILLKLLVVFFSLILFLNTKLAYASNKDLTVREGVFIDRYGRQVMLHGINLVCKDKGRNYIGPWGELDFVKLKEWGINCVRLGIIWDGLEPSPGYIDNKYLEGIDRFIDLAGKNNIYVILDMHQDLYSHKFGGDGAPEWAIIDEGKPHIHLGGVWSDAYFTSPAIKTAFDNFWDNKSAIDGVRLQDHYALCWKAVAERYANNPIVIGYDIMNEPFIGSDIDKVWENMVKKFLEETKITSSSKELESLWFDAHKRIEIIKKLSDPQIFTSIIDSTEEIYKKFEIGKLIPFYRRVVSAIREIDKESLLFLEPSVSANIGVRSGIEKIDELQVYAPHAYDILTDTPFIRDSDFTRISMIFKRHEETRKDLGIPMLIGEWGAFGSNTGVKDVALFIVKVMEELQCGETYWAYSGYKGIETSEYFDAIKRPYPMKIAGRLIYYKFDRENGLFECEWEEDDKIKINETIIYLHKLSIKNIKIIPEAKFSIEGAGDSGYLTIYSTNDKRRKRRLEILF